MTFMNQKNQPWDLRSSDFSRQGWHTKPTSAYMLMFEFLRLSPSYELARVHRTTGLSKEQKKTLPTDFKQVLATYDRLGDVRTALFRGWWLNRGLPAFGNPYSKPIVHKIASLRPNQDVMLVDVSDELNQFLIDTRSDEGLTESLLVSIPLGGSRSDVLKQINKLLEQNPPIKVKPINPTNQLKLMGQRLHANVLLKGVRLLWLKAAKPKWENWRLGAYTKLSPSYASVLNYEGPKKTASAIEQDDRIVMGKITSRALKRFEHIAENAARGKFPCDKPCECSPFDYAALAKRIKQTLRWEKTEKARLKTLQGVKKAQAEANKN